MNNLGKILQKDAKIVCGKVDMKELAGKTMIVTGASGLIGINFLMSLKEFCAKLEVKNPPNITAVIFGDMKKCFSDFIGFKELSFKKGDITDIDFVGTLPESDYIIHAAGYGQPGKFMQDKVKTISINTSSTMSLLKKLKPDGKFLFISSSEVYSGLTDSPYREDQIGTTNTMHPRACYIEGKRCGEAICGAYFQKGRKVKSARLSLAYGPGTKPHDMRVLNSFIERGLTGKIELMDSGQAKRTYCYVSDAVEIMWNILLFGKQPIYNVGGFSATTIASLAENIGKILKAEVSIPEADTGLSGAPDDVRLDMSLVRKEFNKLQSDYTSLESGLKNTIEWQRELYKNN